MIWKKVVEYIDSHSCHETITRQGLLFHVYGEKRKWYPWTVDNYRRFLTKAGYLQWEALGVYSIIKHIGNKSMCKVKYEAYPMIPLLEKWRRKKEYDNIDMYYRFYHMPDLKE